MSDGPGAGEEVRLVSRSDHRPWGSLWLSLPRSGSRRKGLRDGGGLRIQKAMEDWQVDRGSWEWEGYVLRSQVHKA